MMRIKWKPISGYEGFYEVSDDGQVRSFPRGRMVKEIRILKKRLTVKGYCYISLFKNNVGVNHYIHRLVLEAFVGKCPDGYEACHENGNRDDNRIVNLRWGTPKSNQADRKRHGTYQNGENHCGAKLSESDVKLIRELVASGINKKKIAEQFGVTYSNIWTISKYKSWNS